MAISSLSLTFTSTNLPNQLQARNWRMAAEPPSSSSSSCSNGVVNCSITTWVDQQDKRSSRRTALVLGIGALALNVIPSSPLLAEEKPKNYEVFVDEKDGYSYYYPSDWRDFNFVGHDSAFKDRYMQLQNVRLSFIPTLKTDIHELGPMEEVVTNLVTNVFSAPSQVADILDMQEKTIDGKSYYTFEYILTSPNFARAAFATIAIGNGRYYTLIVGANERRWKRYRNSLKVVADSFKVFDI